MPVVPIGSQDPLSKFDKLSNVALIMAFLGMFWAASPFVLPQPEKKEVGEVVVDIAKSMLKAVKGKKSLEPLPPTKTFLEKVLENTFVGSLALAVTSFVISIIMYIMGAKGRLFSATMIVNIVTFALNVLLLALAIALIFAAIRFLESGDFSIFG